VAFSIPSIILPRQEIIAEQLFDLGFFVSDMFTRLGIELHDLHFAWHSALVFGRRIEVTRTSGRFQLDFVAA
jgi:hypothetical protein